MVLIQRSLQKRYVFVDVEVKPLCFTANTAGSSVRLNKSWNPTIVNLETSTDWENRSSYTINTTITLSNIWDKLYFRNTSETDTWFTIDWSNYYNFVVTGSIAVSWDVTTLLNKNWTKTLSDWCFWRLFQDATKITSTPEIPVTTLWVRSCQYMFYWCSNITTLPKLFATELPTWCYYGMFQDCSKITLMGAQTWVYQTEYRIPYSWTWTELWNYATQNMFYATWWVYNPNINTTYYTNNTLVW